MQTEPIKHLKKVTLLLLAGSGPEKFDLIDSPVPFKFVYGVASNGLCPFESALNDKHEGDKWVISVSVSDLRPFFGHLFHNLPPALGPQIMQKVSDLRPFFGHLFHNLPPALGPQIMPETIYMEIEVASITDADDREIVQAVGKSLAHGGCGGSCGCGC